jgi:hypothetical protein
VVNEGAKSVSYRLNPLNNPANIPRPIPADIDLDFRPGSVNAWQRHDRGVRIHGDDNSSFYDLSVDMDDFASVPNSSTSDFDSGSNPSITNDVSDATAKKNSSGNSTFLNRVRRASKSGLTCGYDHSPSNQNLPMQI